MGWQRLAGSLKLCVSFAKEPYKREDILQKRPVIFRSLLIVATHIRLLWTILLLHFMYIYIFTCVYVYIYVRHSLKPPITPTTRGERFLGVHCGGGTSLFHHRSTRACRRRALMLKMRAPNYLVFVHVYLFVCVYVNVHVYIYVYFCVSK